MIGTTLVGDTKATERMIVAKFIQECEGDPAKEPVLDCFVQVFTGILIEDFLGTIQSLSGKTRYSQLRVYYDTTVLLRLLGTSGQLLRLGTTEMHNALQQLGCYTQYLDITQREVRRILDGILDNPEGAHPETAEAYYNGELRIDEILDLPDTFEVRLKSAADLLQLNPVGPKTGPFESA